MQNCENDKSDHQMRKKYFQFQRNEQSEIVSELHQCFWGGLSEVWEKTKITLCFTHIQEGWQEFSRKLVTSKIYFEAVTFPAAALRGSPHSSHNQVLLWDEQACLDFTCTGSFGNLKYKNSPTCLFWLQVVVAPTCPVCPPPHWANTGSWSNFVWITL